MKFVSIEDDGSCDISVSLFVYQIDQEIDVLFSRSPFPNGKTLVEKIYSIYNFWHHMNVVSSVGDCHLQIFLVF